MSHSPEPVVVAVNETEASLRALDWATEEAGRLNRPLRIVYVFEWPVFHSLPQGLPGFDINEIAHRVVRRAEDRARKRAPRLEIEALHITAEVEPALLMEAQRAYLLVVGSRGLTGTEALFLGSTGLRLASTAACPVVIVPDRLIGTPQGRLVVGLDGSDAAQTAADWAFDLAEVRAARLRVVSVRGPQQLDVFGAPAESAADTERRVADAIASHRDLHPDVQVDLRVLDGHPAEVLSEQAADADLLVVGSRGRGGFTGMLLGSVSQGVMWKAACPVMIARPGRR